MFANWFRFCLTHTLKNSLHVNNLNSKLYVKQEHSLIYEEISFYSWIQYCGTLVKKIQQLVVGFRLLKILAIMISAMIMIIMMILMWKKRKTKKVMLILVMKMMYLNNILIIILLIQQVYVFIFYETRSKNIISKAVLSFYLEIVH